MDLSILQALADDDAFGVADLLRKLDGQPLTVESAGKNVDDARRAKGHALSLLNSAKQTLQMAEAMAAMNMPADAKNDVQRKAHITAATASEARAVLEADNDVIRADGVVAAAARDHQLQQDILVSLQKKADVIAAAFRFLAPR